MKKNELQENLNVIKLELETEVPEEDILAVESKLNKLSTLMGLSAETLKHAKKIVLERQKIIFSMADKNMSPTMFKYYLEGEMADELSLYTYADRLNAALVHCSDSLRTIISKYKEELRLSNYVTNNQ